jgi:hypothetical protein
MRIMAVCNNCQRDLLLSQLVEGPQITARCPWCGTLLAPHYTLLLADAVQALRGGLGEGFFWVLSPLVQAPDPARVCP